MVAGFRWSDATGHATVPASPSLNRDIHFRLAAALVLTFSDSAASEDGHRVGWCRMRNSAGNPVTELRDLLQGIQLVQIVGYRSVLVTRLSRLRLPPRAG